MKTENRTDEDTLIKKDNNLKIYTEPKIIKIGKIQKVTLGGSIGTGDSGFPNTFPPNG